MTDKMNDEVDDEMTDKINEGINSEMTNNMTDEINKNLNNMTSKIISSKENIKHKKLKIGSLHVKESEIKDLINSLSRFRRIGIFKITKNLPQDIVLPFYMLWLPDNKVMMHIGTGIQFSRECINTFKY